MSGFWKTFGKRACALCLLLALAAPAGANETKGYYIDGTPMGENLCAVTFDDGPNPSTTLQLLETLDSLGVQATFFMLGRNAQAYPDVVKKVAEAGHEIGSHTYGHANLKAVSHDRRVAEITRAHQILSELGANPRLMRPPYGNRNEDVDAIAQSLGLTIVLWSHDTLDWKRLPEDYRQLISSSGHRANGLMHGVFLFHDIHKRTVDDIPRAISQLREAGCQRFVTVSDLLDQIFTDPEPSALMTRHVRKSQTPPKTQPQEQPQPLDQQAAADGQDPVAQSAAMAPGETRETATPSALPTETAPAGQASVQPTETAPTPEHASAPLTAAAAPAEQSSALPKATPTAGQASAQPTETAPTPEHASAPLTATAAPAEQSSALPKATATAPAPEQDQDQDSAGYLTPLQKLVAMLKGEETQKGQPGAQGLLPQPTSNLQASSKPTSSVPVATQAPGSTQSSTSAQPSAPTATAPAATQISASTQPSTATQTSAATASVAEPKSTPAPDASQNVSTERKITLPPAKMRPPCARIVASQPMLAPKKLSTSTAKDERGMDVQLRPWGGFVRDPI